MNELNTLPESIDAARFRAVGLSHAQSASAFNYFLGALSVTKVPSKLNREIARMIADAVEHGKRTNS